MTIEIARIDVKEGAGSAFEAAVRAAAPVFRAADGCGGIELRRSAEVPHRYWLLVRWNDVASHERFRATDGFARWRALAGPHFAAPPVVEHAEEIPAMEEGL